jgi:hypothetical protein
VIQTDISKNCCNETHKEKTAACYKMEACISGTKQLHNTWHICSTLEIEMDDYNYLLQSIFSLMHVLNWAHWLLVFFQTSLYSTPFSPFHRYRHKWHFHLHAAGTSRNIPVLQCPVSYGCIAGQSQLTVPTVIQPCLPFCSMTCILSFSVKILKNSVKNSAKGCIQEMIIIKMNKLSKRM